MKYMISGYGTGSRTKTGQDESRSFRTMRGKIDVSETSVEFRAAGVVYKDRHVPAMKLNGTSRKVGRDADDNEVSLFLHDMTAEEAMEMSARFAEYAVFLQKQKIHQKVLIGEGTRFRKAVAAAGEAFADYERRAGTIALLEGLATAFGKSLKSCEDALRFDKGGSVFAETIGKAWASTAPAWTARRAWNSRVLNLISALVTELEAGPKTQSGNQEKPGLRVVDPR